jgi:hypothetical protein
MKRKPPSWQSHDDLSFTLTLRVNPAVNSRVHEIARRTHRQSSEIYRWLVSFGIEHWNRTGKLPKLEDSDAED